MSARSAARHRSREAALQILYGVDLACARSDTTRDAAVGDALASAGRHFELPSAARGFAEELVLGVCKHLEDLDSVLEAHSAHWRLARMAAVDRNVLRLAVYEIRHQSLPAAVAIDEAVELARRFGGERSPAFVNGVLDAVAQAHSGEAS